MPAIKRIKTDYKGVYYIMGTSVKGKPERIYYIRYWKDGKQIDEKAGRQFENQRTPARASTLRAERIRGKEMTNAERRAAQEAAKKAQNNRWTVTRLFAEYKKSRVSNKGLRIDEGRFNNYLKEPFGSKEPTEILPLDVDRVRVKLSKKLSPQTVKHVIDLLVRLCKFGVDKGLSSGLLFKPTRPKITNNKTEDLTPDQLKALLEAMDKDINVQARNMMKLALYTGMRRGELFKLKWNDIDFHRGFINIRDPKGGPDQVIPLNDAAKGVLESHPKMKGPYVFPGRDGKQRVDINHQIKRIKDNAGLPKGFRALHGLRHVYASMLASSGEVDMYHLQRLLTHKDPRMTQRYAHLRDESLKRASNLAGQLVTDAIKGLKKKDEETA
jgi:integrase